VASADETRGDVRSVIRHGDVSWVDVDGAVVVHRHRTGGAFLLDPMASVLWQCLDGESSLTDVFADIAEVVGVDTATVAGDCLPVVQSWLRAGIALDVAALATPAPEPTIRTWRRLVDPPNA